MGGAKLQQGATEIGASGFLHGADAYLPEGFAVGSAEDAAGETGCTAILCPAGAVAGVDVRGAAPATRETDLLRPECTVQEIHAVMLSGGSAFGLDAAGGVMRFLEEAGAGVAFGGCVVPIVVSAALFDLKAGKGRARPDAEMGYAACKAAGQKPRVGRVGAGAGATVGKLLGASQAMPGGLGACSFLSNEAHVTAIVAVNALGNVYDASSGFALAGARDPLSEDGRIIDPLQAFALAAAAAPDGVRGQQAEGGARSQHASDSVRGNTTIGCVLTNAKLTKAQATRVATMAHDGFARAIHPVHTGFDGDVVFCMAKGSCQTSPDLIGTMAALAMEQAIHNAVS